jgi:glutamate dehydrogenase (NADP+)
MADIMDVIKDRDPQEREFHQAVSEVMESVKPVLDQNPIYRQRPGKCSGEQGFSD